MLKSITLRRIVALHVHASDPYGVSVKDTFRGVFLFYGYGLGNSQNLHAEYACTNFILLV